MTDLLYKDEVYAIVGAAMDVYNDLGPGFFENVYQEAMDKLTLKDECQLINYLKATGLKVSVLINFGHYPTLQWKRLLFTQEFFSPATKPGLLREDSSDYQAQISEE